MLADWNLIWPHEVADILTAVFLSSNSSAAVSNAYTGMLPAYQTPKMSKRKRQYGTFPCSEDTQAEIVRFEDDKKFTNSYHKIR
jgi:hypothetical protein